MKKRGSASTKRPRGALPAKKSKPADKKPPTPAEESSSESSELRSSDANEYSPYVICRGVTDWRRFDEFVGHVERISLHSSSGVCRVLIHGDDALLQFSSSEKVKAAWSSLPTMIPAQRYQRVSPEAAESTPWKYPLPEVVSLKTRQGGGYDSAAIITAGSTNFEIRYNRDDTGNIGARLDVSHAAGHLCFIHPEQFENFAKLCAHVAKSFRNAERPSYRREFRRLQYSKEEGEKNLWSNVLKEIDDPREFNVSDEIDLLAPFVPIPDN